MVERNKIILKRLLSFDSGYENDARCEEYCKANQIEYEFDVLVEDFIGSLSEYQARCIVNYIIGLELN